MFRTWLRHQQPSWLILGLVIVAVVLEIQAPYRKPGKLSPKGSSNDIYVNVSSHNPVAMDADKVLSTRDE